MVELSLELNFDRTLGQLERAQPMRLGQPLLSKLEVHYSVSRKRREGKERASRITPAAGQPEKLQDGSDSRRETLRFAQAKVRYQKT